MSRQAISVLALSILAAGSITKQRFVKADGTQAGADANTIGVARSDASSGQYVTVDALGTAYVEAGGSITAGATIETDASGRAVTWATSGPKVAIALEASTGSGQIIEVLLIPNAA
jgi:hypothetical protein